MSDDPQRLRRYFGTDGVRCRANEGGMSPEAVLKLALAAGHYFTKEPRRHRVIIGKDTRLSGYMVENALTAGFTAVGMNVTLLGPLPTSAIGFLITSLRADLGVMISASHNPFYDNGIKFFGPDGYKLEDSVEQKIEEMLSEDSASLLVGSERIGQAKRLDDAQGRYIEFVKSTFPKATKLNGLRLVVDCANGAAYKVAPLVFWELGADVITLGNQPNGININDRCGVMDVDLLRQTVLKFNANLGIALDGDADRLVIVDEKGGIIDGDQLLALIALSWKVSGRLKKNTVVGTVMSNVGLEMYLRDQGLRFVRTPVGDRYISAYLKERGCNIGGEQSGHMILGDYATTGDGIIAALQVLAEIVSSGQPLSHLAYLFEKVPQVLRNVRFKVDPLQIKCPQVEQAMVDAQKSLGSSGRLLVRKSGTEPLIRLMAEGPDESRLNQVLDHIIQTMKNHGYV